ncbi:hypothetical protein BpHYR1_045913 [Brachionus plicatilis]|uniref:Uncharacterized protein n=1 Tax=Brachionus plicatilis TaxID=10195 RepID=A0A3M7PYD7_BRAPC|nr:hypothetical protein BpHYR1_045913 [Brachionus plicatilis]
MNRKTFGSSIEDNKISEIIRIQNILNKITFENIFDGDLGQFLNDLRIDYLINLIFGYFLPYFVLSFYLLLSNNNKPGSLTGAPPRPPFILFK